jgi:hypothetical protein
MPVGVATSNLNLRAGAGTQFRVLRVLPPKTRLEVQSRDGDWFRVEALGLEGWVHRQFVLLSDAGPPDGFLRTGSLADVPLAPPPAKRIVLGAAAGGEQRLVASTWNRYGGLLGLVADHMGFHPGAAVAVLGIESGGRGFAPDGKMIIRFENHVFFDQWGKSHAQTFDRHFQFRPDKRWLGHRWRLAPKGAWQEFHGNQSLEWKVFEFATSWSRDAAMLSISMGGPQIMGFNHAAVGFESVQQMFDAFSSSVRDQIIGFFDFVRGPSASSRRLLALREQDFDSFASLYNGPGQAARYGSLIRTAFETFQSLVPA